jgi:hypothetical protein
LPFVELLFAVGINDNGEYPYSAGSACPILVDQAGQQFVRIARPTSNLARSTYNTIGEHGLLALPLLFVGLGLLRPLVLVVCFGEHGLSVNKLLLLCCPPLLAPKLCMEGHGLSVDNLLPPTLLGLSLLL